MLKRQLGDLKLCGPVERAWTVVTLPFCVSSRIASCWRKVSVHFLRHLNVGQQYLVWHRRGNPYRSSQS